MISENTKATDRASELISRGLTDEKIIAEIIRNEKPIPKRLTAELYDKVNYMCRRWMDRIVRFEIEYDFIPNIRVLKTVLLCLFVVFLAFGTVFTVSLNNDGIISGVISNKTDLIFKHEMEKTELSPFSDIAVSLAKDGIGRCLRQGGETYLGG